MPGSDVMATEDTVGVVGRAEPLTLIMREGVVPECCEKLPVLLAVRLWAAFPMLAPSTGVPSSLSEAVNCTETPAPP